MKILSDYPELRGVEFPSVEACEAEEKAVEQRRVEEKTRKEEKRAEIEAMIAEIGVAEAEWREAHQKASQQIADARKAYNQAVQAARDTESEAKEKYVRLVNEVYKKTGIRYACPNVFIDEIFRSIMNI